MNIPVSLPLDNDGFLRRECPSCRQQFKWHNGPANDEAEGQASAELYFCPFCGQSAAPDQWLTGEQLAYIQGAAMPGIMRLVDDELSSLFKGMNSKHLKVKQTGHLDVPDEPDALIEPDDMAIVASPCHGWEPIKVPDDIASPVHCLVCGRPFAL